MPFLFTCPHCQSKTQVEDRYSGQKGNCATCGQPIQIPVFASSAPTAEVQTTKSTLPWIIGTAVALVLLGCLGFAVFQFGGDTVAQLSNNRAQNTSMRNLKKIATALNAYASEHGKYPPPAILDANNQPILSWRVSILPYLGEKELYDKFDLTQDWTVQTNMQLMYEMPAVFRHPSSDDFYTPQSDYYLIIGPGTLFPPAGPLNPKKIADSSSQTILVIEGAPSSTNNSWTEPVDLNFSKMTGQINGSAGDDPGQHLEEGVAFATADGRSHFLSNETGVGTFNALVTPNGGEPLADDTLD